MQALVRQLLLPRSWFAAYLAWFCLLFYLSSQAGFGPDVQTFPHADKVVHATYFAAGSTGLGIGLLLWRPGIPRSRLLWILLAAALAVGWFDEVHQWYTPGRSGKDLGDLAADGLGGAIGFFLALRLFGFARGRGILARVAA